jgi:hypothetical protein
MTRKKTASRRPAGSDEPVAGDALKLSPSAEALIRDVSEGWDLTPPVRTLLRLAGEAMTKAEELERITAREGMTIGDQKGSTKPHPAALLARDYRAQASGALQRLLSHLEG